MVEWQTKEALQQNNGEGAVNYQNQLSTIKIKGER